MTDQAQQAWIINGGRHDVYSSCEGAGGYENELIIHPPAIAGGTDDPNDES